MTGYMDIQKENYRYREFFNTFTTYCVRLHSHCRIKGYFTIDIKTLPSKCNKDRVNISQLQSIRTEDNTFVSI